MNPLEADFEISEEQIDELPKLARLTKPVPIVNFRGAIRRNAQCPCGSGKKFKRCCMVLKAARLT